MSDQPRLFPLTLQPQLAPTLDRAKIFEEVQCGLRNERDRLKDAAENQAFIDLDGERFVPLREAETEFDYAGRPKRDSGFAHQAINRLCEHTYNPGPRRSATDAPAADKLLQQVYEQCHIDAVMHESDTLATTNCVTAIEVKATNDPDRPIDLQIWGGEEFAVFLDPRDQRKPIAVVTIDRVDEKTRFRLYFDDVIHTFETAQAQLDANRPSVMAYPVGDPEENTYKCLPFAFLAYSPPVRRFWTPAPGSFLRRGEERINDRLSKLDEHIEKYLNPIGIFKNVSPEFNPEVGPGRFLRLFRGMGGYTGDGYSEQGEPSAEYLQAMLGVEQVWSDIREFMGQLAEAIDLPPSSLRLDYSDAPSGLSIIIRTAPLLARARKRRPTYQWAETDLAKTICTCYGNHYGAPELVAAAKVLRMLLSWPEPRIPIPGPERDQADAFELQEGSKSRFQLIEERYGLTRDQAVEHFKQVAKDETEADTIKPPPAPIDPTTGLPVVNDQGDGKDEEDDDEKDENDE
jgi:hypothetical protein